MLMLMYDRRQSEEKTNENYWVGVSANITIK